MTPLSFSMPNVLRLGPPVSTRVGAEPASFFEREAGQRPVAKVFQGRPKVVILTDQGMQRAGLLFGTQHSLLLQSDLEFHVWSRVGANPQTGPPHPRQPIQPRRVRRDRRLGGGSATDTAMGAAAIATAASPARRCPES